MLIEEGSRPYLYIPVTFLAAAADGVTAEVALVAEGAGPAEGDWHDASWDGAQARVMVAYAGAAGGTGCPEYPPGEYMAMVRLSVGLEQVVLTSGRVRVG